MDNDELFRKILRGLNKDFYHQTVTSKQVEEYVSRKSGFDYSKIFDQYLRTTQIPKLEFYLADKKVFYRWTNCVKGFNLPVVLKKDQTKIRFIPTEQWKSTELKEGQAALITKDAIVKMYYVDVVATEKNKTAQK
jgi:aminopeptidase N